MQSFQNLEYWPSNIKIGRLFEETSEATKKSEDSTIIKYKEHGWDERIIKIQKIIW